MEQLLVIFSHNQVFSVALFVLLGIGLLEGVLSLVGFGFSNIFDSLFPESDLDLIEIENPSTTFSELFSWINKGNVPVIMILLTFLAYFGIIGIFIQENLFKLAHFRLDNMFIIPLVIILTLPFIRWTTSFLSRIIPKDETTAVSQRTFIGGLAVITLGKSTYNVPAEAKYRDSFGQDHYIMVQSTSEDISFSEGETVLLLKQLENTVFLVSKDPNSFVS